MAAPKLNEETTTKTTRIPSGLDIKLAFLHQSILVPGIIGNEKTLSLAKMPDLKMTWTNQGLMINRKGKTAIVPHANVACAILADE